MPTQFRSIAIRLVLSALVSFVVLALLLHLVGGAGNQDKNPGLWKIITGISFGMMAGYVVCAFLQAWLRSLRYRLLLTSAGVADVPSRFHMMLVTMARNMFVDLLPSRIGELAYVGLLNRGYRVPGADCISSLALSFIFDLVALAFLVAMIIFYYMLSATAPAWLWIALGFIVVISLTGLFVLFYGAGWAGRVMHRIIGSRTLMKPLPAVVRFIDQVIVSFDTVKKAGTLGRTLILSLGVRFLKYGGIYFAFIAITRENFPELARAGFWQVLSALLGAEAAASLPLPTMMSFGSYEAGGTAVWKMLGFPASSGALAMLAMHVCSQVVDYTMGGLGLLTLSAVGYPAVSRPASATSSRSRVNIVLAYGAAVCLLVVAAGFAFKEYRAFKKLGTLNAPQIGFALAAKEDSLPSWLNELNGVVVWSSNRGGNHDIYRMDLPSGTMTQLTRHPHTEYYPRISPDGSRIVFSRSQIPWVSQRNKIPWDVYMMDLNSGMETLIATNANVPVWLSDTEIIYQFNAAEIIRHNVETGEQVSLLHPGMGDISGKFSIDTPSYNPDTGQMGVSIRPVRQTSALIERDGKIRPFGNGCQVNWSPDRSWIYYVDHLPGKDNAFFKVNPQTFEKTTWFNNPGPYNHEYFPRLADNERFLIFGAAAEGHEHDTADYEIFLWRVGSKMDDTIRLTWHTGNDCWPDIWLKK
jgi:uncharacterized membrane protein YbhN (UPF0104 family)